MSGFPPSGLPPNPKEPGHGILENGDFHPEAIRLDAERAIEEIDEALRTCLRTHLKRRGLVVALSGGIDSSVTAALATRAIGPERVFGVLMPERDSSSETLPRARKLTELLDIDYVVEDITAALEGVRCYERYDAAVRLAVPDYGPGWKSKIVLSPAQGRTGYPLYSIVAESPSGDTTTAQLRAQAYLEIVAATNFKQRTRKMLEYYHADRLNYAVAGTPNRLEYDQGFFVKGGDGLADVKPIAHLYKTQVYQLAEHLGLPEEIRNQKPSTDTYSLEQTQDEFYFGLPYDKMDLCLYGLNQSASPEDVARAVGMTPEQVELVFQDIRRKRLATRPLHLHSLLVPNVT